MAALNAAPSLARWMATYDCARPGDRRTGDLHRATSPCRADICPADRATVHHLPYRQFWSPTHAVWSRLQDRRLPADRWRGTGLQDSALGHAASVVHQHWFGTAGRG